MGILKRRKISVVSAIVLFMTSAVMPLSAARERRGATVVVTMTGGNWVKGELLAVRGDFLLVYDRDARLGISLDRQQVVQVLVHKRTRFLDGITIGICAGLAVSIYNLTKIDRESLLPPVEIVGSFLPLPVVAFGGGLLGGLFSIPKKISMAGVSPQIVQRNLTRLKRFAREADFLR
jgi:hypothetical protein